jgi:hypothetical protein
MVQKAVVRMRSYEKHRIYGKVIYLPKDLVEDSSFPFRNADELEVEIVGEMLVIRRVKE